MLEVLEEHPMVGEGCRQRSRQLFFSEQEQPSVGCRHCQELAPFLAAAAACSRLFQLCPETHARNSNGCESTQLALWAGGAELWLLATRAWGKLPLLPGSSWDRGPWPLRCLSGHCSWKQPCPGLLSKKECGTREQDKNWL